VFTATPKREGGTPRGGGEKKCEKTVTFRPSNMRKEHAEHKPDVRKKTIPSEMARGGEKKLETSQKKMLQN